MVMVLLQDLVFDTTAITANDGVSHMPVSWDQNGSPQESTFNNRPYTETVAMAR